MATVAVTLHDPEGAEVGAEVGADEVGAEVAADEVGAGVAAMVGADVGVEDEEHEAGHDVVSTLTLAERT